MQSNRGAILIFASSVLYGSYGVWSVWLGDDFGTFFQSYVRSIIVLSVVIPVLLFTKSWQHIDKRDLKFYAISSLFAAGTQVPIYYAFQHAGVGISTLLMFAMYLVTSFAFGRILLREHLTRNKFSSLLLAFVGLGVIFGSSLGGFELPALLCATLSGFCFGGYVSSTKLIPQKYSGLQTMVVIWAVGLVISLAASIAIGEKQVAPGLDRHWLVMCVYALAGVAASYFVIQGFKRVDASLGSIIGLLEIPFSVLFGIVFFQEGLAWTRIVGSIIIVSAATLPYVSNLKAATSPEPTVST